MSSHIAYFNIYGEMPEDSARSIADRLAKELSDDILDRVEISVEKNDGVFSLSVVPTEDPPRDDIWEAVSETLVGVLAKLGSDAAFSYDMDDPDYDKEYGYISREEVHVIDPCEMAWRAAQEKAAELAAESARKAAPTA